MKIIVIASLAIVLSIFCSAPHVSEANIPAALTQPQNVLPFSKYKKAVQILPTAYYKPLKGQKRYAWGSYRNEVRVNGTGETRSGKAARIGHLAADIQYYPFGTEMHLVINGEYCGKWVVEDIGPAIKGRHRLDLFMGEGDHGLKMATKINRNNHKMEVIAFVTKWGKKRSS